METPLHEEVGGSESHKTRDSPAELQLVLCWFLPVTGLKGIKLGLLVSDLAAGLSFTASWSGQCCPPQGTLPRSALPALLCRVWDQVGRSCVS